MTTTTPTARPIVKWAGGKQSLAGTLVTRFPEKFGTYFEPFVGGASVLLQFAPAKAVVGDMNAWLIDLYRAVSEDPAKVASKLKRLPNTKEDFLRLRAIDPWTLDLETRAAHLVYLNKTCFRGLFRVNRKGQFNVPYGAYQRRYFDPANLAAFSERLRKVELRCGDFEANVSGVRRGDFVYFDPPYFKLGGYSDFNRYTPGQFREDDHKRLAGFCRSLDQQGVRWALSNSDTDFVRELYDGFRVEQIDGRREINLNSKGRGVRELLIRNY